MTLIEPAGVPPGTPSGDPSAASNAVTDAVVSTLGAIGTPSYSYMVVTAVTLGPPTTCSLVPPATPGGPTPSPLTGVKVKAGFVPYVNQTVLVVTAGTDMWVDGSFQGGSGEDLGLIGFFQQVPTGNWLLLNGGTFNATTFPALYAKLGTNVLPDLRNKFIVGAGSTYAEGTTGGATTQTLTQANLPNITLSEKSPLHSHGPGSGETSYFGFTQGGTSGLTNQNMTVASGQANTTAAVNSPGVQVSLGGSATPVNILPPYYGLYACIKAA